LILKEVRITLILLTRYLGTNTIWCVLGESLWDRWWFNWL